MGPLHTPRYLLHAELLAAKTWCKRQNSSLDPYVPIGDDPKKSWITAAVLFHFMMRNLMENLLPESSRGVKFMLSFCIPSVDLL
jgi:hypothetical protein